MLIHPSQLSDLRRELPGVAALLVVLPVIGVLPASVTAAASAGQLLLHAALATLSIALAGMTFGVTWGVRRGNVPGNFIVLAVAFLGVGVLQFSHLLWSGAMPGPAIPAGSAASVPFLPVAPLLAALALLAVAWLPWRRGWPGLWYVLLPAVACVVAAVFAWYPHLLPPAAAARMSVAGRGGGPPAAGIAGGVIAIGAVAALRLAWCLRAPRTFNAGGLLAAACAFAAGGIFFARHVPASGAALLAGQVCVAFGCAIVCRVVFVETVRRPYARMQGSQQQLRATLDALPDLLFELDGDGRYLDVHAGRPHELAAAVERLLGRTVQDVLPAAAADVALAALVEADEHGISRGKVLAMESAGGGRRWFELSVSRKAAPAEGGLRFVVISRDITQRRLAEEELSKLSSAVAQSPVSIVITDLDGRIEYANAAFAHTTGYAAGESAGHHLEALLATDKTPASVRAELWASLAKGQAWQGELVNRRKSGDEYVDSVLAYPLRDVDGNITHFISHQQDVTEQRQAAERIRQLSHFDQLTGLPNRSMLQDHFRYAAARGRGVAVLWVDLDRFKDVNDSLGHGVGDQLLQEAARRLQANVGAGDMVTRHSGDKFVVVAPATDQAAAALLAQQLLAALAQPVQLAGQELFTTVSVGIAVFPEDAGGLDALLKNAEIAMYRAKQEGRNCYRFFAPEMQAHATRTLALGNALQQVLQRDELHLVYQPQTSLADGCITGVEALLRWRSPQWGVVTPAEFVPVAEANGLIVPIGEWVLRTALRQWRQWRARGLPPMTMAVNLSAVQFNEPDLADRIADLLDAAGVPPEYLELELTEAVAMKSPDDAARKIELLRRRRIHLAIDDFGTGYSSLSYLKRFKTHTIKIDQSFVRDIGVDPDDQAIVGAIIEMARSLGMRTIAEGVETTGQLAFLRARGCDEVQGYLFGEPLLPGPLEALVRARSRTAPQGADRERVLPA